MRISNLAKKLLKLLPVFVLLAATAIGLFLGKDLSPTLFDSHLKTPTQLPTESANPQPFIILGEAGPVVFLISIYRCLPNAKRPREASSPPRGHRHPSV